MHSHLLLYFFLESPATLFCTRETLHDGKLVQGTSKITGSTSKTRPEGTYKATKLHFQTTALPSNPSFGDPVVNESDDANKPEPSNL